VCGGRGVRCVRVVGVCAYVYVHMLTHVTHTVRCGVPERVSIAAEEKLGSAGQGAMCWVGVSVREL
jgi:hypothetical protein